MKELTWHIIRNTTTIFQCVVCVTLRITVFLRIYAEMQQMAFCGEKALSPFWWIASQFCACAHHIRLNANHNISVQRHSEILVHHIWEVSRIM